MKHFLSAFLLFSSLATFAQVQLGGETGEIDYANPVEMTIGGIVVTGVDGLDADAIILLSGLSVGDIVQVPGDRISLAVKNLWKQNLFGDVQIKRVKTVDKQIFLEFALTERPRLSRFKFEGVSKSEADDLRESLNLVRGMRVTDNLKNEIINTVESFFTEKGFLFSTSEVIEQVDTLGQNGVLLRINVEKGNRIKINEILVNNNVELSDGKIRRSLKDTKQKKWWRIFAMSKYREDLFKEDQKKVISKYNAKGLRDAIIVSDSMYRFNEKTVNVELTIEEGKIYYFRNITWIGNTKHTTAELADILSIKKGDVYNQELLDSRLFMNQNGRDVSSVYMDDGYLFFQIMPVEILVENDSIDLEMRIIEGKQARVNKVTVIGNSKTNDHVILREVRTKPGDLFSRSDIIRTQRELANLGYFDPEKLNVIPTPNQEEGTVDIEYIVEERPSDQIEVSGGWGGNTVVGTLGLSFTNFSTKKVFKKQGWRPIPSGDGQRISIRAQTNGTWFQSYNFSFTEPWWGGRKPNSFTLSAYRSIQTNGEKRKIKEDGVKFINPDRQSIVITGVSVGLGKRLTWPDDYFTLLQDISYQHYNLNNFTSLFSFSDGVANNISYAANISRNSVDQPIYPRSGSRLSLSLKLTPPWSMFDQVDDYDELSDQEKYRFIEYHKWKFTSSWFTKIVGDLVLNTRIGFGFLGSYNKQIGTSPFERFYLGGSGLSGFNVDAREIIALRGYQDNFLSPQIGSSMIAKYTTELRYPLSLNPNATIFTLAFIEAGNSWTNFKQYNPFAVKRSAGLGLRIFLPMFGVMGLDYAWGFDSLDPYQVGFGNHTAGKGQFHFTIGMNIGEL